MSPEEIKFMNERRNQYPNLVIAMPNSGMTLMMALFHQVDTYTCGNHPIEFYQGIRKVSDSGQFEGSFGKGNEADESFRAASKEADRLMMTYNLRSIFFHTHARNRSHCTESLGLNDGGELELFVGMIREWNEICYGESVIKITWLIRDIGEIYERSGLDRKSLNDQLERFKAASELEDQWINYKDLIDPEKAQKIMLWTGPRLYPKIEDIKRIIK